MNDDFLHRLRVRPAPQFLARLKSKLDREPLRPRVSVVSTVLAAVLAGASAWALASFALRGEFAGLHWSVWGIHAAGSEYVAKSAPPRAGSPDSRQGWGPNPWAAANRPAQEPSHKNTAIATPGVVPIPQSTTAAPGATTAQYSGGVGLVQAPPVRLRMGVAPGAELLVRRMVERFVRGGNTLPEPTVGTTERLLASLCAAGRPLDFVVVPRRMTAAESAGCNTPWGGGAVEVKLGSEALVIVRSRLYGALPLSTLDIYRALGKTIPGPGNPGALMLNRYTTWNEVDRALPPDRIQVLGPAFDSAQGQLFRRFVMQRGCESVPSFDALQSADQEVACRDVRTDGAYASAPEQYSALLQKLQMLPTLLAIVPYGTLQLTGDALIASPIDGIEPTPATIASGAYPGSRIVYLYANRNPRVSPAVLRFLKYGLDALDMDAPSGAFVPVPRAERDQIRTSTLSTLTQ
ncbi:MAG TPA: substrate-binding domain-containing protein [Steroidobacteraceae bacterium]|nr:substrate-binding domain-containing protein [Steroidobacteraceae bacterium]